MYRVYSSHTAATLAPTIMAQEAMITVIQMEIGMNAVDTDKDKECLTLYKKF